MRTVVISHANCGDGAASAAAFTAKGFAHAAKLHGVSADTYRSSTYPCIDPSLVTIHMTHERDFDKDDRMPDIRGCNVFITDFSYPLRTLRCLDRLAASVTVFDHHPNIESQQVPPWFILDETKCAARITWQRVHGVMPWFIDHIEDRDLWLDRHKFSKQFNEMYHVEGVNLSNLLRYLDYNDEEILRHYQNGAIAMTAAAATLRYICSSACYAEFATPVGKFNVIAINAPSHISDAGNYLMSGINRRGAKTTPEKPDFVVLYRWDLENSQWNVSLRGENGRYDLTAISRSFGGGGHLNAAGFVYKDNFVALLTPPGTSRESV